MANGETLTAFKAQDNPVGITEKYIYIIRNYINEKVYIGQAIDPVQRFKGHINDAKRKYNLSAIDGAIYKYGAENFYYEILEEKTKDYNEREKYWISFFKSKCPNGYNIQDGGEDPPIRHGFDNNKCKFSEQDVSDIKQLIKNPSVTLSEIAQAFGVSYRTISSINMGKTYYSCDVDYPIRKFRSSGESEHMLSDSAVDSVIWDIANTSIPLRQIAMKHNISNSQAREINEGTVPRYSRDGVEYPLRKSELFVSDKDAALIKKLLLEGVLSKNQIASKAGVSYAVVSNINSGRAHFDEDLVYPLKKHEGRYDYTEDVFEAVRSMLRRGDNPKTIASQLHLPNVSMVYDINTGKTHVSGKYEYPIQKFNNKFSDETILAITRDIAKTNKTLSQIAKEYGMNKSTVQYLKNGKYIKYRIPGFTYPLR